VAVPRPRRAPAGPEATGARRLRKAASHPEGRGGPWP
jgi:hypothetical protein